METYYCRSFLKKYMKRVKMKLLYNRAMMAPLDTKANK